MIIPSNVKTIGYKAFLDCNLLTDVKVEATIPPNLIGDNIGFGIQYATFATAYTTPTLTISVPSASLNEYKQAWTDDKLLNLPNGSRGRRTAIKWEGY